MWFTADLHLGHRLVSGLRGFHRTDGEPDVDAHDGAILANWDRTVATDDVVWVLGDLAVTGSRVRLLAILATINALPGRKHLITGNHDPVHPMHRSAHKWQRTYLETFESVQPFARVAVAGQRVLLSHFPYGADHTESPRYGQYRLRDEGAWLLHGHTHAPVQRTGPREIHVGLDAWRLRPVSAHELATLIDDD